MTSYKLIWIAANLMAITGAVTCGAAFVSLRKELGYWVGIPTGIGFIVMLLVVLALWMPPLSYQ